VSLLRTSPSCPHHISHNPQAPFCSPCEKGLSTITHPALCCLPTR
jgi:hypothetical protein